MSNNGVCVMGNQLQQLRPIDGFSDVIVTARL